MATKTIHICDMCRTEKEIVEVMPGQVPGWYVLQLSKFGYSMKKNFLLCEPCAEKSNRTFVDMCEGLNKEARAEWLRGEWDTSRDASDRRIAGDGSFVDDQNEYENPDPK